MKTSIYPYSMKSKSVLELRKTLSDRLGYRVFLISHEGSKYVHNSRKLLINWGSNKAELTAHQGNGPVLNPTRAIQLCSNKTRFFQAVSPHARTPEFTTEYGVASEWMQQGKVVMGRTERGKSGSGITFSDEGDISRKPLFVEYVPKKHEFRVHIYKGRIIDIQQKKLRTTDENGMAVDRNHVNFRVRNHENGFIFARQDIQVPQDVADQALQAFNAIPQLDFGAFDVIYNQKRNQAYVLECNTAPGLEGQTVDAYANSIVQDIQSMGR